MNKLRVSKYKSIAHKLSLMSNEEIEQLTHCVNNCSKSIGGTSFQITIDSQPVFVKKIKITDLEMLPENFKVTRNHFNLPLCYQYGVGSTGFGAWREVAAHETTTNWVLNDLCINFPLMYHYLILPSEPHETTQEDLKKIRNDIDYWEGSNSIKSRLIALENSSNEILIFLEYFPYNLHDWTKAQIKKTDIDSQLTFQLIEEELKHTVAFMKSNGLIHMDAHFWNILTDGNHIYFTDFGLALSSSFELGIDEIAFFNRHQNYDYYSSITNFLYSIITSLFGENNWIENLKLIVDGKMDIPEKYRSFVDCYSSIAILMDKFYMGMQKVSKNTSLPIDNLDRLLINALNHK